MHPDRAYMTSCCLSVRCASLALVASAWRRGRRKLSISCTSMPCAAGLVTMSMRAACMQQKGGEWSSSLLRLARMQQRGGASGEWTERLVARWQAAGRCTTEQGLGRYSCRRHGCEVRVRRCVAMHACRHPGCEVRMRRCVAMHACRRQGCEVRVRRCMAMHACQRQGCEVRVRRCAAKHACCPPLRV